MKKYKELDFWNDKKIVHEFVDYPKDLYWQEYLKKVKTKEKQKLLDMGCGGGRNSELAAQEGYDVYGCDYSKSMVEATQKRLKKLLGEKVSKRFVEANMCNLPYEANEFDLIISNGVLHNAYSLEDFEKAINELSRTLKTNGLLLLNLFTSDNLDTVSIKAVNNENLYVTTKDLRMTLFSSNEIVKIFASVGLNPIEEIQLYTRDLNTGKRSVFKTVFINNKNE